MLKSRFEWISLFLVATLLGGGWIIISREQQSDPGYAVLTEAPMVGQLAPDFTLTTAVSQSHTLSNYIGQPIVLNFWATWCGPCRIEMPYFQEASEKYNGRVTFLGINDGETPTLVTDFAAEYGVTYPLLLDNGRSVNILYNIRSLPTTLFINANGTVDEIIIGTINQGVLEDRLEKLLEASS